MEIILSGRQTGRTSRLIALAAEAEAKGECSYIVCVSTQEAYRISQQAKRQGMNIGFPITYDELLSGEFHGGHIKNFYIDNADWLLKYLTRGVKLAAITLEEEESNL